MGGCTITRSGNNRRKVIDEVREQIRLGYEKYHLEADSSFVVLKPKNPEVNQVYEVVYGRHHIIFKKTDKPLRAGLPVTVAQAYHKVRGTWLATVHIHT